MRVLSLVYVDGNCERVFFFLLLSPFPCFEILHQGQVRRLYVDSSKLLEFLVNLKQSPQLSAVKCCLQTAVLISFSKNF